MRAPRRDSPAARRGLAVAIYLWLGGASLLAQAADARALLRSAMQSYDQAMDLVARDPQAAIEAFHQSAAGFEGLAALGIRNASLEYDLGNTYARLGDSGRAILHYKRGLRLNPAHAHLAANLDFARQRVRPLIAVSGRQQLAERLLFWNRYTTDVQRFWLCAAGSILGWALLLGWWHSRRAALLPLSALAIVLGVANGASVAWEHTESARRPEAVIVAGSPTLRLARGEGAEPARNEPLGPGVELRILQERAGWIEIELADGQTGWVPDRGIERMQTLPAASR